MADLVFEVMKSMQNKSFDSKGVRTILVIQPRFTLVINSS